MNRIYKLVWSKTKNMYVAVNEYAKSKTKAPSANVISRTLVTGVLASVISCGAVMPQVYANVASTGSIASGALSLSSGNNSIAIGTNAIATGNNAGQDLAGEIRNINNQIQQNLTEKKTEYNTSRVNYDNVNNYVSSLKSSKAISYYNQNINYQNEINNVLQPQLETAIEQYNTYKANYDGLIEKKNEAVSKLSNLNFDGYYNSDGSVNRNAFSNQLKTNVENNTSFNLSSSFYSNYVDSYLASLNNNPSQIKLYSIGGNSYNKDKVVLDDFSSRFLNFLGTFEPNVFNDIVSNSTFKSYDVVRDMFWPESDNTLLRSALFPISSFWDRSSLYVDISKSMNSYYSFSDSEYSSRISNLNSAYQNNKSAYVSLLSKLENNRLFTSEEINSLAVALNKEYDYAYQIAYAIADMGHEQYLFENSTTEEEKVLHYQNILNIKNNINNNINPKDGILYNAIEQYGSSIGYDINTGETGQGKDYGDFGLLLYKFLAKKIYNNYSTVSQLQEIADKTISNELEIAQNKELVDSVNNSITSINKSIEDNQRKINDNQDYINANNLNGIIEDYESALADLEQKQLKMNADAEALAEAEQQLSAFMEDLSSGENAIAIGTNSLTTGKNAIGMGSLAVVTGEDAVGIGRDVILTAEKAVAVGPENTVSAENSVALGSENAITAANSIAIGKGNVVSGSNSVALGNNINVTEDNVVSVGNRRIMGVATGVADTDAVNVKQLNDALQAVAMQGSGVGYDAGSTDKITLAGDNGTKITNLKQGTLSATSTDAVTGAQLYVTNQNISGFANDITRNKNSIRNLNTSVTTALSSVAATSDLIDTINNIKADTSLNNLTATGRQVIATTALNAVQDYLNSYGGGTANPVAPMAYNPNTLNVTNAGNSSLYVGEGSNVNGSSSIAIGVGNQVNANNAGAFGDPSIINADESYVLGNDDTVNTGAVGSFIVGNDSVSNAKGSLLFGSDSKTETTAENSVGLGNNVTVAGKGSVALGYQSTATEDNMVSVGNDTLKRRITNVADGNITENSTDAVTGKQLYATNEKVEANTLAIAQKADIDASNIDTTAWIEKLGTGKVQENDSNLVTGGTVFNAISAVEQNSPVKATNEAIFIGANQTDNLISVYNQNGEGRVITGVVTNPEDATSATNVGYVNAVATNMLENINGRFSETDRRMNKVGANAAALASLTPASFEGDEKWSLAASVGHYKGETAGAVGAFYRPAENVMLNVRGAVGNGENMMGAGVAVSLTKGDIPGVTKRQLAKEVISLKQNQQAMMQDREQDKQVIVEYQQKVAEQGEQIAKQNKQIANQEQQIKELIKRLEAVEKR